MKLVCLSSLIVTATAFNGAETRPAKEMAAGGNELLASRGLTPRGGGGSYGGGGASCSSVFFNAGQYCINGNLYNCNSRFDMGQLLQTCSDGCTPAPPGVPDSCDPPPRPSYGPSCTYGPQSGFSSAGNYCINADLWYCGSAYNAARLVQSCANGCTPRPPGIPDTCDPYVPPSPSGPSCGYVPYVGAATYCIAGNLWQCNTQWSTGTLVRSCQYGCTAAPSGQPDYCNGSPVTAPACSRWNNCGQCTGSGCVFHFATSTSAATCSSSDVQCDFQMSSRSGGYSAAASTPMFCASSYGACSGSSATVSVGKGGFCGASSAAASTCKAGCTCGSSGWSSNSVCQGNCAW